MRQTRIFWWTFLLATSFAYAEAPRHVRRFPKTIYLSEIPLNTTYGNGNTWTGWTGRWVDWPLMVDRSIPYIEGRQYRVTWPDLRRTLTEMGLGGMDGATFNVARRENGLMIAPLRYDCAAWFGGRKGRLFKGLIRNVRIDYR